MPVQYGEDLPTLDLSDAILDMVDFPRLVKDLIVNKSVDWKYEQEWRIIHKDSKTNFSYPVKALKAIYLGDKFDPNHSDLIKKRCLKDARHVLVYKGTISKTRYGVDFDPI